MHQRPCIALGFIVKLRYFLFQARGLFAFSGVFHSKCTVKLKTEVRVAQKDDPPAHKRAVMEIYASASVNIEYVYNVVDVTSVCVCVFQ